MRGAIDPPRPDGMTKLHLIPVLLLPACVAPRVPPGSATSRFGVVHAADADTAKEYARLLDDVAPFVAAALPGLVVEPVDLRVVQGISETAEISPHSEFAGAAFEGGTMRWVEIRSDLEPDARRGVLGHELVHRWLGPAWDTLPPALEDGLAEIVNDAIRGEEPPRERMLKFIACWLTLNRDLTLDQNAAPAPPDAEPFTVTFHANIRRLEPADIVDVMSRDLEGYHTLSDPRHFAVVAILARRLLSRISVDQLFEACQVAAEEGWPRVPVRRIFEMARIDPYSLEDWNALLLETYGLEERKALKKEAVIPWGVSSPMEKEGLGLAFHLQASIEF